MVVDSRERVELDTEPPDPSPPARPGRGLALGLLVPLILVAVAGTLRFYRLGEPERCYFDETYYYYDARDLLDQGVERDFVVHPPLGKWMIAGGLAMFGVPDGSPLDTAVTDDPGGCSVRDQDENPPARAREAAESFARRAASALFGTLWVGVAYLAGLRLFRRRGIAALSALLLTVEGLAFTMSRIAMLDVFLSFWVTVGFWLLLVDRDEQWATAPDRESGALPRPRRWARWLAGLAFGLALATKWSAVLAIGAAGLFVLVSELAWRRRLAGRMFVRLGAIVVSGLATLVLVPLVVYVLSYIPWFVNFEDTERGVCPEEGCPTTTLGTAVFRGRSWVGEQGQIYRFHRDLDAEHPYRASAQTWPVLARPVAYYYEKCDAGADPATCHVAPGTVGEILGIGNPVIWWLGLPAYLVILWAAIRRRDAAAWAILGFLAAQYFPWLASPRTVFLFYATPAVPFLCFAVAYAATLVARRPGLGWVPAAVAVLALGGFLFWYPVLTGSEIPREAWDLRIWIRPGWV